MLARKCDRCGQFYDAPKDDEVCGFVWLTGGGGTSFKNVDLCPDCTDKLSDWLEPSEEKPNRTEIPGAMEEQVKMRLSGMTPKEIGSKLGIDKTSVAVNISKFKKAHPERYAELQKEAEENSCAP